MGQLVRVSAQTTPDLKRVPQYSKKIIIVLRGGGGRSDNNFNARQVRFVQKGAEGAPGNEASLIQLSCTPFSNYRITIAEIQ